MSALAGRAPIEIGTVLEGRYRIESVLGAGGMGVVFRAMHLELRQPVAIKMPHLAMSNDAAIVERLLREGRAAVRLRSEHVCRVLDVGRTPAGLPFVVLEYLEGTVLSERLRRKKVLAFDEIWRVLLEACEAVGEAHQLGIVHRDLKPHNLFLVRAPNGRRRVKVLDFGISKVDNPEDPDHRLTESSTVLGSPSYIAPEQMSDTHAADARADVWGLGVCAYEMITGRLPFKGSSVMDLAVRIAGDAVVLPSTLRADVPPALEAIVLRCLEKARDDRYASADALAAALVEAAPPEIAVEYRRDGPGARRASSFAMAAASPVVAVPDDTLGAIAVTETSRTPSMNDAPLLLATVPDRPSERSPVKATTGSLAAERPRELPRAERPRRTWLGALAAIGVLVVVVGAAYLTKLEAARTAGVSSDAARPQEPHESSSSASSASSAASLPIAAASGASTPAPASASPPAASAPVAAVSTPSPSRRPSRAAPAPKPSAIDPDAIPRTR